MRGSPFSFSNFSRGLNVIDSPYTLTEGECRDVLNMVSSPRGAIKKRFGSIGLATSSSTSFPVLAVTDSFVRADEDPLSNAGKWELPVFGGETVLNTGRILSNGWKTKALGVQSSAAIWNVAEQTNPAVSVEVSVLPYNEPGTSQQRMFVKCCMAKGKSEGYGLEYELQPGNELYTVRLVRYKPTGTFRTYLLTIVNQPLNAGDSIGISVRGGVVYGWRKSGGTWTRTVEAADSTYTKGYGGVAMFNESTTAQAAFNNFSVGEQPASTFPSEEVQSIARVEVSGTSYLIAAVGTKLYSINPAGEFAEIGSGLTAAAANKWAVVQTTTGAPNREPAKGPAYMSNGVDAPHSWSGATKSTASTVWTSKAEGQFLETPKAKFLTYLGNRIWASGIAGDTSALRFSGFSVKAEEGEQADPTSWPKENVVWFEKDDGQEITGTGIAGAYLMVFKKHKTWAVYDLNEGENRRVSDSVGCVSYRSIVETPQGTFFLTPDQGVFVTNGTSVKEVSRNVRPILQGTDTKPERAAKVDQLSKAAAGYINGHYYLTYLAQDGSTKTLDYDVVLQSWWLHDLGGNQWVVWEPASVPALYTCPKTTTAGVVKAFAEGVYQDSGANYKGALGLSCYWLSPWEPFWQYFMRHRFNQPNPKKTVRELFVDGKGELITLVGRKFNSTLEELKGTVDNEDMASPKSPVTLGTVSLETQAVRYWSLGHSRVWSFGFGNHSGEPLEIDSYSCHLTFRKS